MCDIVQDVETMHYPCKQLQYLEIVSAIDICNIKKYKKYFQMLSAVNESEI